MRKRLLIGLLALVFCAAMLPATALAAENDIISVGGVELSGNSAYAKTDVKTGAVTTEDASGTDYNIHWDAATTTLTLDGANIIVSEIAAISAALDRLTIALIGENTITVSKSAPQQSEPNYAAIVNTTGSIGLEGTGRLTLSLTMTGTTNSLTCTAAAIQAETSFSNAAVVNINAKGESGTEYDIYGIEADGISDCSFSNSGNLDITVTTASENASAIHTTVKTFENSGTIIANVNSTGSGDVCGVNCLYDGSSTDEKTLINSGKIEILAQTISGEGANGIIVYNTQGPIYLENKVGATMSMNSSSGCNTSGYSVSANGIDLITNVDNRLKNYGRIEITASHFIATNGIHMASYWNNAEFDNNGYIEIDSSADDYYAYGISMDLNYINDTTPHRTALNLNSGSELHITTHTKSTTGEAYCEAIHQQRCYTSEAEGDGEDQIYFNRTVLQESGEVHTEYQNAFGMHYYITSIADSEGIPLSEINVIPTTPVSSISLGESSLSLTAGDTATLTATVKPDDATDKTVTWESSNPSVATVDEYGNVTAVGAGAATITATANDGSGVEAACTVTVNPYIPPVPSYLITLNDPDNGTVTADRATARQGTEVTLTVTPEEGYAVDGITVTDFFGNRVDVVRNSDGTYSFVMPYSQVTVSVTFAAEEPIVFTDVDADDYFYNAVYWAVESGVTDGTSDTQFSPGRTVTRGEMVTFLWRAAGSPEPETTANPFADVDGDDYYYTAVLWAVENGITDGVSATQFDPDGECTRAQMVTFLWRAAGQPDAGTSNPFTDVDVEDYYGEAVLWAVASGVTDGVSEITFEPGTVCTRAQAVTFLYRAQG